MNEYQKKSKEAADKARALFEAAKAAGRDLTADEDTEFNNLVAQSQKYATQGVTLETLEEQEKIQKQFQRPDGRISTPEAAEPEIHNEMHKYNLCKAISDVVEFGHVRGIEAEVHSELSKNRIRCGGKVRGLMVPSDLRMAKDRKKFGLDLTSGSGSIGTETVGFIESLRNTTVLNQAGATFVRLNGNQRIPKQTGTSTAYWVDANGTNTITASAPAVADYVSLIPKQLTARVFYTRDFLKQSTLDAQTFVLGEVEKTMGGKWDQTGIAGSGSGAESAGVLYDSDVSVYNFTSSGATYAGVIAMKAAVAAQNAETNNMAFITSSNGAYAFEATPKVANQPIYILGDDGKMARVPVLVSNAVPSDLSYTFSGSVATTGLSGICYGNWEDLLMATFNDGLDLIIDPYTAANTLTVWITVAMDACVAIRRPESFCVSKNLKTS